MFILENIRDSSPHNLHANDSPEGFLSNRDSGIAGIILSVEKISVFHDPYVVICQHFCSQIIMIITRTN